MQQPFSEAGTSLGFDRLSIGDTEALSEIGVNSELVIKNNVLESIVQVENELESANNLNSELVIETANELDSNVQVENELESANNLNSELVIETTNELESIVQFENELKPANNLNSELVIETTNELESKVHFDLDEETGSGGKSDPCADDWSDVSGRQVEFDWIDILNIQSSVPSAEHSPSDLYELFLDTEVLECMVTETNRYAKEIMSGKSSLKEQSRFKQWADTNVSEMRLFIGILLWMGLVIMPSIACYWKTDTLYRNSISSKLSRNCFQLLLRAWHFVDNSADDDNSSDPAGNRLRKIDAFLKLLLDKFVAAKCPGREVVIDESMVPFRGRLKFRQYLPNKAHKYGIKLFKLCDTAGYTYNIEIYSGKKENVVERDVSGKVVLSLIDAYLDQGRTLFTDNYYTSLDLAKKLLKRKTHLVETLRSNRKGIPHVVTSTKLKAGEIIGKENNDGIVIFKWKDKRDVLMLSTRHTSKMISTGKKNRKQEAMLKPDAVICYNKHKQGIDLSDQMSSYHKPLRKSIRWFHKVAIDLIIGVAVVNAHILYNERQREVGKKTMQITMFREKLCEDFISTPADSLQKNSDKQGGEWSDRCKRKYCIGCYERMFRKVGRSTARRKAKRVITICNACPGKPGGYCFNCFARFHAVQLSETALQSSRMTPVERTEILCFDSLNETPTTSRDDQRGSIIHRPCDWSASSPGRLTSSSIVLDCDLNPGQGSTAAAHRLIK